MIEAAGLDLAVDGGETARASGLPTIGNGGAHGEGRRREVWGTGQ